MRKQSIDISFPSSTRSAESRVPTDADYYPFHGTFPLLIKNSHRDTVQQAEIARVETAKQYPVLKVKGHSPNSLSEL